MVKGSSIFLVPSLQRVNSNSFPLPLQRSYRESEDSFDSLIFQWKHIYSKTMSWAEWAPWELPLLCFAVLPALRGSAWMFWQIMDAGNCSGGFQPSLPALWNTNKCKFTLEIKENILATKWARDATLRRFESFLLRLGQTSINYISAKGFQGRGDNLVCALPWKSAGCRWGGCVHLMHSEKTLFSVEMFLPMQRPLDQTLKTAVFLFRA